jgi:hypothetical protein
MFTSFGYFKAEEENRKVLANMARSLRPGGAVVIDLMGTERMARIFQPTTSQKAPDGSVLVERHEICDDWARIRNEWILVRNGRAKTFEFLLNLYSGRELKTLLRGAGFPRIRLFGDLDGSEYGPEAQRLVAVAWKGEEHEG